MELAKSVLLYDEFLLFVRGFCDSLRIFKELLPDRPRTKGSFTQESLVRDYLENDKIKKAHNATNDVLMLQNLLQTLGANKDLICKHTKDVNFREKAQEVKKKTGLVKKTLENIEIGKGIKLKLAKAGITRDKLVNACKMGRDTLEILLRETVNGKPRVTSNKKIINSIYEQLLV